MTRSRFGPHTWAKTKPMSYRYLPKPRKRDRKAEAARRRQRLDELVAESQRMGLDVLVNNANPA